VIVNEYDFTNMSISAGQSGKGFAERSHVSRFVSHWNYNRCFQDEPLNVGFQLRSKKRFVGINKTGPFIEQDIPCICLRTGSRVDMLQSIIKVSIINPSMFLYSLV
jgi:hypothetical protein